MRSPQWTEASVQSLPSEEEREVDRQRFLVALECLSRGHDISRPTPGDGRCAKHAIRGCRCGQRIGGT